MELEENIILKLGKDVKRSAERLGRRQARFLVDGYYTLQNSRVRASNQLSAHEKMADEAPAEVLSWVAQNMVTLENSIKTALHAYAKSDPVGAWSLGVTGIGPVIAAALLAHIDITVCPTVGHIWSFAGLNPNRQWLGRVKSEALVNRLLEDNEEVTPEIIAQAAAASGADAEALTRFFEMYQVDKSGRSCSQKRALVKAMSRCPWNAGLKTICWKIGDSFLKQSGREGAVYGKLLLERKALEEQRNEARAFSDQAAKSLLEKNYGRSTEAYKWYKDGKLPPARILLRAQRYAVKQFLADWHRVAYRVHFKKDPPLPYPIAILGHAHFEDRIGDAGVA